MYLEPHVPSARIDRVISDDDDPFISLRSKVLLSLLCCFVISSCGYLLKSGSNAPERLHAQQSSPPLKE